eukprot:6214723-Pleurochrysis_carterae.AAC.4
MRLIHKPLALGTHRISAEARAPSFSGYGATRPLPGSLRGYPPRAAMKDCKLRATLLLGCNLDEGIPILLNIYRDMNA